MQKSQTPSDWAGTARDTLNRYAVLYRSVHDAFMILSDDLTEATGTLDKSDTQFYRRVFVRAIEAYVEGFVQLIKQLCLFRHGVGQVKYGAAELAILREEAYQLAENGKASISQRLIQVGRNLRFVFPALARIYDQSLEIDVTAAGWSQLQHTIKVRNRITHPRTAEDLQVSDDDLEQAKAAVVWFYSSAKDLLDLGAKEPPESPKIPVV